MFALRLKETSGLAEGAKAELYPKGHRAVSSHPNSGRLNGKNWIVVGHRGCWRRSSNGDDSAALAEEMDRVPARLSAFLPRSPLPTSDDDGARCRGIPCKIWWHTFRVSYVVAGVQTTLIEYFSTSKLGAQLADTN